MHSITYCSYWKRGGREERDANKTNKKEERSREGSGGGRGGWGRTSDTRQMVLVKLAWSNLVTGGWGGLPRDTEAENCPLMSLGVFNTCARSDRRKQSN